MDVPRRLAVRVGVFAAASAAIGFVIILLIGSQGMLLSSKRRYHVSFPDVAGLREGAVVRLGGRDVGDVSEIHFGPLGDPERKLVVTVRVRESFADRVRLDSTARISSQGLLGDKLIELTLGSPAVPQVEDDGWLVGEPAGDPSRLIASATAATEHARNILMRFDEATRDLDARQTLEEVERTLRAVRHVAERIETGPGTAHELIFNEELAGSAKRAVRSVDRAAVQGEKLIASARRSADRLAEVTAAVDPSKVKKVTDDVAHIVGEVRAGRGTLGGLIIDPTLYEETKRILVNIRRNRVLKAVARLVISDEMPQELMDGNPPVVRPRHAPEVLPSSVKAQSRPSRAR
jgi:phospholipid/cholesterol/gamma-HCH transport system substrate-binding protein